MSTTEIINIVCIACIFIVQTVLNVTQRILIKRYDKALAESYSCATFNYNL